MNDLVAAGGRRSSLLAVLAATLLPFLGIYSVFGQLDSMARTMVVGEILQRGMFTTSMTGLLNPSTTHRMLVLGGVIVGVHIARRGLDLLHDKLGWTVLGLAAAVLEAFFMVVFLFSGTLLLRRGWNWLGDTRLGGWFLELREGFLTSAGEISAGLPAVLTSLGSFITGDLWVWLSNALLQPLLWLAVAALIFGSQAITLGEMWSIGEPESVGLSQERNEQRRERNRRRSAGAARRFVLEAQEALFGDFDDKYMPAFLSVRLMLRAGLGVLGAFVLLHALVSANRDLSRVELVCLDSSFVYVVRSRVTFDLGVGDPQQFLERTRYQTVTSGQSVIEVDR